MPKIKSEMINTDSRFVQVTGRSTVTREPNYVIINMTLSIDDPDYRTVLIKGNELLDKIKQKLFKIGIAEAEITSGNMKLSKRHSYDSNDKYPHMHDMKFKDFEADYPLEICFDYDKNLFNKAITAITSVIERPVLSVHLTLKDNSDVYSQAAAEAIEDAKSKAECACKAANCKLGRLLKAYLGRDLIKSELNYSSRDFFDIFGSTDASSFNDKELRMKYIPEVYSYGELVFQQEVECVWEILD